MAGRQFEGNARANEVSQHAHVWLSLSVMSCKSFAVLFYCGIWRFAAESRVKLQRQLNDNRNVAYLEQTRGLVVRVSYY
jgi:hypothetical protein